MSKPYLIDVSREKRKEAMLRNGGEFVFDRQHFSSEELQRCAQELRDQYTKLVANNNQDQARTSRLGMFSKPSLDVSVTSTPVETNNNSFRNGKRRK